MRAALTPLASIVLAALLAGCSGGGPKGGDPASLVDDEEFDGLEATGQTGVIRGVVLDEAIRPLAGAVIGLVVDGEPRNTTSAESGAFGFDGLAPGTYFLQVSKAGFGTVQQSTDVAAGVDEPEIVKVMLQADPLARPYAVPYSFEGFIGCSARYFIEGRNFCGPVNENERTLFDVDPDMVPTFAQAELVWDSTQLLGDALSLNWRRDDTSQDYIDIEGTSPLILSTNETMFAEEEVGAGQPLRTIIFTAHNEATEPPECIPDNPVLSGCLWGVGVQVNQKFMLYIHVFYNMVPPEGWTFGEFGDP